MEISNDKLKNLLSEAFDLGYHGSRAFRDEYVEEIIARHQSRQEHDYRVYTVQELNQLPVGSVFHHSTMGRGWIVALADGMKSMQFERGQNGGTKSRIAFIADTKPWDRPMRLLHAEG